MKQSTIDKAMDTIDSDREKIARRLGDIRVIMARYTDNGLITKVTIDDIMETAEQIRTRYNKANP